MTGTRPKIGLALGGGGARGWAHIGVIQALRDARVDVCCVAGTSMGAFVGAALAADKLDSLHQVALELDWRRVLYYFLEFSLPRMGLIDGARIVDFVREHVRADDIRDLSMPFAAVATDIQTGDEVVFTEGPITDAVRASIAIPGLFTPLVRNGRLLVDGGLVNPLPVAPARNLGADVVIAVDITRAPLKAKNGNAKEAVEETALERTLKQTAANEGVRKILKALNIQLNEKDVAKLPSMKKWFAREELPNIFDIYGNTMRIVQKQITAVRLKLEPPDLLIQPDVQDIHTMDFHRAEDAIQAGYTATQKALKQHPELAVGSTA